MDQSFLSLDFKFSVIYEDEKMIVINKPAGILTHRTKISEDDVFVLQILRKQVGHRVYPIHRLDRATTGVLLFAKDKEVAGVLNQIFREKKVWKTYLAIARGHLPEKGIIDKVLFSESKQKEQEAFTRFESIAFTEMPWEVSRYPNSRYTLVKLNPETGRHHQLRKHLAKLRHPIIGDRRHGDVKHNNYWRDKFGVNRLWLHAFRLKFSLEAEEKIFDFQAPMPEDFIAMLKELNLPFSFFKF